MGAQKSVDSILWVNKQTVQEFREGSNDCRGAAILG